jgi:hypothetical protein
VGVQALRGALGGRPSPQGFLCSRSLAALWPLCSFLEPAWGALPATGAAGDDARGAWLLGWWGVVLREHASARVAQPLLLRSRLTGPLFCISPLSDLKNNQLTNVTPGVFGKLAALRSLCVSRCAWGAAGCFACAWVAGRLALGCRSLGQRLAVFASELRPRT